MTIKEQIRQRIAAKGITQRQLAQQTGIAQ